MTPPREAGTGRGQAGGLARSLPEGAANGAACFSVCVKAPQKPLKPTGLLETRAQTAKTGRGLVESASPRSLPITSVSTPTHSCTAGGQDEKPAPSAVKPPRASRGRVESRPVGFRGEESTTPAPTPFTPAPQSEYREVCELHASLSDYLERERPALLAQDEGAALRELERLASLMLDRMSELEAQGAHRGSAGGEG